MQCGRARLRVALECAEVAVEAVAADMGLETAAAGVHGLFGCPVDLCVESERLDDASGEVSLRYYARKVVAGARERIERVTVTRAGDMRLALATFFRNFFWKTDPSRRFRLLAISLENRPSGAKSHRKSECWRPRERQHNHKDPRDIPKQPQTLWPMAVLCAYLAIRPALDRYSTST